MYNARIIVQLLYRIFLLSLIFGVLWVKGYLWWVFGVAILLYVMDIALNLPIGRIREIDDSSDEEDEESDVENNGEEQPPL
jgi:hypothetical protein